jgi:hypothetical protein
MSQSSSYAFPQDLAFEGGEDGHQPSHCTAARCGQVQRLGKRYEADAQMFQLLQSSQQIGDRSSPAIQPSHQDNADIPAPCRFH